MDLLCSAATGFLGGLLGSALILWWLYSRQDDQRTGHVEPRDPWPRA